MTVEASFPTRADRHLTSPGYRPDIDGLRAAAVLAVIGFHAFPDWIKGGFVGVDIFFVISGYLISTILFINLEQGSFSFPAFYARRIRRIFPALILVLGCVYVCGRFILLSNEYEQLGKHIAGSAGFMANFVSWSEAGYFDTAAETKPLWHIWSLGVEEQFYIAWPLLLYLAWKWRFSALWLTLGIIVASFAFNVHATRLEPAEAFYSPFARFWELLAGGALACFAQRKAVTEPVAFGRWPATWRNIQALAGVFLICGSVFCLDKERQFPGWWALLPVMGTCCVISAGPDAWINRTALAGKAMVWIGLISYPLYLWHWPLLSFLHILGNGPPSQKACIAAVLTSFVFAWLTYRLVEKPLRFGAYGKTKVIVLCVLMAVVGHKGYDAYLHRGFSLGGSPAAESKNVTEDENSIDTDLARSIQDLYGNVSCQESLGRVRVDKEVCFASSKQPDILILGDSHAMAFDAAVFAGKFTLNTLLIAGHGCLPFIDYISRAGNENVSQKNCRNIAEDALDAIKTIPSIKTIVLVSRGPFYFAGLDFMNGADQKVDNAIYKIDSNDPIDSKKAFVDGYSDIIDTLLKSGKRIVFVIDWPALGLDPHQCIAKRPIEDAQSPLPGCMNKRQGVEEREKEYRELVAEIKNRNPGLIVYDPLPVFCDQENCYGRDARSVYYSDKDHLSISGSKKLLKTFSDWLDRQ